MYERTGDSRRCRQDQTEQVVHGLAILFGSAGDSCLEPSQLVRADLVIPKKRNQELLSGVSEKSLQELANLALAGILLSDAGTIKKSAPLLPVTYIPLLLKDSNGGQYGCVGKWCRIRHIRDKI
jgi:hypothetical protein